MRSSHVIHPLDLLQDSGSVSLLFWCLSPSWWKWQVSDRCWCWPPPPHGWLLSLPSLFVFQFWLSWRVKTVRTLSDLQTSICNVIIVIPPLAIHFMLNVYWSIHINTVRNNQVSVWNIIALNNVIHYYWISLILKLITLTFRDYILKSNKSWNPINSRELMF